VPDSFLDPRATWADPEAYDRAAAKLCAMFRENFAGFADGLSPEVAAAGPIGPAD
jgi:phosphoenolpyruvate carboxykinase (ATP)